MDNTKHAVAATGLLVAAMRAEESARDDALFHDPFAERLAGDNPEMRYWHAIALLGLSKVDDGLAMLREIGRRDRNWIELTLRLPAILLGADQSVKDRIRKLLD